MNNLEMQFEISFEKYLHLAKTHKNIIHEQASRQAKASAERKMRLALQYSLDAYTNYLATAENIDKVFLKSLNNAIQEENEDKIRFYLFAQDKLTLNDFSNVLVEVLNIFIKRKKCNTLLETSIVEWTLDILLEYENPEAVDVVGAIAYLKPIYQLDVFFKALAFLTNINTEKSKTAIKGFLMHPRSDVRNEAKDCLAYLDKQT